MDPGAVYVDAELGQGIEGLRDDYEHRTRCPAPVLLHIGELERTGAATGLGQPALHLRPGEAAIGRDVDLEDPVPVLQEGRSVDEPGLEAETDGLQPRDGLHLDLFGDLLRDLPGSLVLCRSLLGLLFHELRGAGYAHREMAVGPDPRLDDAISDTILLVRYPVVLAERYEVGTVDHRHIPPRNLRKESGIGEQHVIRRGRSEYLVPVDAHCESVEHVHPAGFQIEIPPRGDGGTQSGMAVHLPQDDGSFVRPQLDPAGVPFKTAVVRDTKGGTGFRVADGRPVIDEGPVGPEVDVLPIGPPRIADPDEAVLAYARMCEIPSGDFPPIVLES